MKEAGIFIVSLSGVNAGFRSVGQVAIIFNGTVKFSFRVSRKEV